MPLKEALNRQRPSSKVPKCTLINQNKFMDSSRQKSGEHGILTETSILGGRMLYTGWTVAFGGKMG